MGNWITKGLSSYWSGAKVVESKNKKGFFNVKTRESDGGYTERVKTKGNNDPDNFSSIDAALKFIEACMKPRK